MRVDNGSNLVDFGLQWGPGTHPEKLDRKKKPEKANPDGVMAHISKWITQGQIQPEYRHI